MAFIHCYSWCCISKIESIFDVVNLWFQEKFCTKILQHKTLKVEYKEPNIIVTKTIDSQIISQAHVSIWSFRYIWFNNFCYKKHTGWGVDNEAALKKIG